MSDVQRFGGLERPGAEPRAGDARLKAHAVTADETPRAGLPFAGTDWASAADVYAAARRGGGRTRAGTNLSNRAPTADPAFPLGAIRRSGLHHKNGTNALGAYLEAETVAAAL